MRFKSPAAGDLRNLTVFQFGMRWTNFKSIYEQDEKVRLALAKIGARI